MGELEDSPKKPNRPASNMTMSRDRMFFQRPPKQKSIQASESPSSGSSTPAPSPTPTSNPTSSSSACAKPSCGFAGVKFTRYKNPFSKDFSSKYDSFELPYFLKLKPEETGYMSDIILTSEASNETYKDAAMDFKTIMHVCESGKYKFFSPKSDDISLLWLGEISESDGTRENADFIQAWYGDNSPKTVEKDLKAGARLPIRMLWGNTNGAGFAELDIFTPSGKKLTERSKEAFLWTNAC